MRKLFLLNIILLSAFAVFASEKQAYYRVQFSDKDGTQFSINKPEEFLSPKAIARRIRFNIAIDETDLPVSNVYLNKLEEAGFDYILQSKWNNSAVVAHARDNGVDELLAFPFIRTAQLVKPSLLTKSSQNKFESTFYMQGAETIGSSDYGNGWDQIHQLHGESLHQKGYRGNGIHIAVIDAGFDGVDTISVFKSLRDEGRLLGTHDFVDPGSNAFRSHDHGTSVLSTIASNTPGYFIGTAPKASFWLLRAEDAASEYPIEEDNWVAALEFADSVGIDLVSSSLGYYEFDESSMNHSFSELDGTSFITSAANRAVQKGILVVNSAGNEGNKSWEKIILPADGENILTVGAVNSLGERAFFSSFGPNASGSIKPNIVALGERTYAVLKNGTIAQVNGTSFSTPIISGIMACLLQAFPAKKPGELKTMLEQSGKQYTSPDTLVGYGIPDIEKILATGKFEFHDHILSVFPNPFENKININASEPVYEVSLLNLNGQRVIVKNNSNDYSSLFNLERIPSGIYILEIKFKEQIIRKKILKN